MSNPENRDDSAYDVGYRKPPEHTRFKKGQSGNPKGRPKGSLNLDTIVKQALETKVIVNENGRRMKKSKLEVSITQMANKAAAGDLKATQMMLGLLPADSQATTHEPAAPDQIDDRAHAIKIVARLAGNDTGNDKKEPDDEAHD